MTWRPFSLLERNWDAQARTVFDDPRHADNVSLIALAVHEAVTADGGNVGAYLHRMFRDERAGARAYADRCLAHPSSEGAADG